MPDNLVHLNEEVIKGQLKELVRNSVEETLNELLELEASNLTQAGKYERARAAKVTEMVTMIGILQPALGMSPCMCNG